MSQLLHYFYKVTIKNLLVPYTLFRTEIMLFG